MYACVLCMWLLAHTHARAVVGGEFAFLGTAFYVWVRVRDGVSVCERKSE